MKSTGIKWVTTSHPRANAQRGSTPARTSPLVKVIRDMRYQGHLVEWNDVRGFGFIQPNGGGAGVFIHISSFDRKTGRPAKGSLVTYELTTDERGRPHARDVANVSLSRRASRAEHLALLFLCSHDLMCGSLFPPGALRRSQDGGGPRWNTL